MTPSLNKGQPVENFLCEDSCICGHAGETVEVRQYYSGGCLSFCCSLSLSALFLFLILLYLVPCFLSSPPISLLSSLLVHSPPSVWPLHSNHHTTDQSAVARAQHPMQSHYAPTCPCGLGQLLLPPCVSGHVLSLVT